MEWPPVDGYSMSRFGRSWEVLWLAKMLAVETVLVLWVSALSQYYRNKDVSSLSAENKNCVSQLKKENGTFSHSSEYNKPGSSPYLHTSIKSWLNKREKVIVWEPDGRATGKVKDGETWNSGARNLFTDPCRGLHLLFFFHPFYRGVGAASHTFACLSSLSSSMGRGTCLCAHPCDTSNPLLLSLLTTAFS